MRATRVFRAPGRVNLIGEHTDHSGGYVLPAAIDRYCEVRATPTGDSTLSAHSANLGESASWALEELPEAERKGDWSDYVCGVARELQAAGVPLAGAQLEIASNVPIGAGLSSSAAIEVSTALALSALAGADIDRTYLARICLRAEQDFVGLQCGIMDQYISCFGRKGQAMLLDCSSLEHRAVPLPAELELVMVDTGVKHELAASEYNRRKLDYEEAIRIMGKPLREVSPGELNGLPERPLKRARHVVSENRRSLDFADAADAGDLACMGELMRESHLSLQNDYEVSCEELDLLATSAWEIEGVVGSRMMGGGFGGCTINLVRSASLEQFRTAIARRFQAQYGRIPATYVCATADGAGEVIDPEPRTESPRLSTPA